MSDHVARVSASSIPSTIDTLPALAPLEPADLATAIGGRLAVAVVYRDAQGRPSRGLRLTVAAAEKFRARLEAEGRPCEVVLVQVVPATIVQPGGHIPGRHEVRRDERGDLMPNAREGR
jgi:hypothetical protein